MIRIFIRAWRDWLGDYLATVTAATLALLVCAFIALFPSATVGERLNAIATILSAAAAIGVGFSAWRSLTRPERMTRRAIAWTLREMLEPTARVWRLIDAKADQNSERVHGLITFSFPRATEMLEDESLDRLKSGLVATDLIRLEEVVYLIPFILSEMTDLYHRNYAIIYEQDPARIYSELRHLLTDLKDAVALYDDQLDIFKGCRRFPRGED